MKDKIGECLEKYKSDIVVITRHDRLKKTKKIKLTTIKIPKILLKQQKCYKLYFTYEKYIDFFLFLFYNCNGDKNDKT